MIEEAINADQVPEDLITSCSSFPETPSNTFRPFFRAQSASNVIALSNWSANSDNPPSTICVTSLRTGQPRQAASTVAC